jgi:hypothetical protein
MRGFWVICGVVALFFGGLFVVSSGEVLGHVDFDVHDGGVAQEDLVAPDLTEENEAERIKQYEKTLDLEEQKGAKEPDVEQALLDLAASGEEGKKERFEEMTKELPFVVLERSLDGDGDGLSNDDEKRLKTRSTSMDTDEEGFIDGLEVVRGYNPVVPSPNDKVVYGEASVKAVSEGEKLYKVTGIRVSSTIGESGATETLIITGMAPANTLVMLFVSSENRKVWVARADESGRFQYSSSDTLDIGKHTIQAVSTDAAGKVLMASDVVEFTRTLDGVDIIKKVEPIATSAVGVTTDGVLDNVSLGMTVFIGGIVLAIVLLVGVVWYAVKWWRSRKTKGETSNIEVT